MLNRFTVLTLLILLGACAEKSPKLIPHKKAEIGIQDLGEVIINYTPKVDILFVIDDSGSMSSHQTNLQKNISLFVNELKANTLLDYNIGVITNDKDNFSFSNNKTGELEGNPKVINKLTPNGLQKLEKNLIVGNSGNYIEAFFSSVWAALSAPLVTNENKGFLRKDAVLGIIFVADAEDQSDIEPRELFDHLVKLKNDDEEKVISFGAIIPSSIASPSCNRDDSSQTPLKIEEFIDMTGGSYFDFCSGNYGQKLAGIGDKIKQRIQSFVHLNKRPALETIVVRYGSQIIPNHNRRGWSYDPQKIGLYFGAEMNLQQEPPGTTVTVSFIPIADLK